MTMSLPLDLIPPGRGARCPAPLDILEYVASAYEDLNLFSTFSPALYDTAWLSMVYKPGTNATLCFPECFNHLLHAQAADGSWTTNATPCDRLVNNLAALLSLSIYREKHSDDLNHEFDIDQRIISATSSTQSLLDSWDIANKDQVGFEVLVPGLLRQLKIFDITFHFPRKKELEELHNEKLRNFSLETIYDQNKTTIVHSVDALIGEIDFDRISHHCSESTGILGSPAATAAYLIYSTKWDLRAVKYLETVLEAYGGRGEVPSAFPTGIFELSWAFSSLVSSVAASKYLDPKTREKYGLFFTRAVEASNGVVGFAKDVLPDANDTARVLMALKHLQLPMNVNPMIQYFQDGSHFKTYHLERNPSFSANCNVLLALLDTEEYDRYSPEIEKALLFLLAEWEAGQISDKWNTAPQYSFMLLSEVLTKVLKASDAGKLQDIPADVLLERTPVIFCQMSASLLRTQRTDGSWEGSLEKTSYSVNAISHSISLPWNPSTKDLLIKSFEKGKIFLETDYSQIESGDFLWVAKTMYRSKLLNIAYCAMAINLQHENHAWQPLVRDQFFLDNQTSNYMGTILSKIPIFANWPFDSFDLELLEARQLSVRLQKLRHSILDRSSIPMSEDKYLRIITIIWVACNRLSDNALPSTTIRESCFVSMLIYQIDELIESVVSEWQMCDIEQLVCLLQQEQRSIEADKIKDVKDSRGKGTASSYQESTNGHEYNLGNQWGANSTSFTTAVESIHKFVSHVIRNAAVVRSPALAQRDLLLEVYNFVLGQIAHVMDNRRLQSKNPHDDDSGKVRQSYFKWVHTTASDDTGCGFALQLFACFISPAGTHCFRGPQSLYYSRALSFHLSAMCRQCNDLGSAARDKAEGNLNSLDFEEFRDYASSNERAGSNTEIMRNGTGLKTSNIDDRKKQNLMAIAEFERLNMNHALEKLGQSIGNAEVMRKLQIFVNVIDTFGQIYIQNDFSSSRNK